MVQYLGPYFISELKFLTNLEVLGLAWNYFDGPIPKEGDLFLLHLQDYLCEQFDILRM